MTDTTQWIRLAVARMRDAVDAEGGSGTITLTDDAISMVRRLVAIFLDGLDGHRTVSQAELDALVTLCESVMLACESAQRSTRGDCLSKEGPS